MGFYAAGELLCWRRGGIGGEISEAIEHRGGQPGWGDTLGGEPAAGGFSGEWTRGIGEGDRGEFFFQRWGGFANPF